MMNNVPNDVPSEAASQVPAGSAFGARASATCHELAAMQRHWWWFLVLGIGWIVLGTVSLSCAPFVTLLTVAFFGVLMVVAGIAQIVSAFWAGKWSGFVLHLLIGILYTVVGFMVMNAPADTAAGLTLLVAAFMFVGGIIRIVVALSEQFSGWGWVLLNGVVTLLLGILIYRHWPLSGLIVIGLFVGIEMIFNGWYWVMLSLAIRRSPPIEC